ncbi:MAG TPA: alpha-hydroxy acid oxidase [Acidimicrobiia bacterium]|nr:alpha-hydroxy acid oxidase [Acidimicrobiia bacterium]
MDSARLEMLARPHIDPMAFDYYAGGADDEITLRANEAAWRQVEFLPHVLRDVTAIDTTTSLVGCDLAVPILIAPMAAQRLAHPDGEAAMARAAAGAGTVMVVSTLSTTSIEDVAAAAPGAPLWFQFYCHRDRGLSRDLLARAGAAGYRAVVLTVDLPVVGRRRRDEINGFALPHDMAMVNVAVTMNRTGEGSALAGYGDAAFDRSLTPADLGWIAEASGLPVLVKGVLRADDAVAAVEHGAAGVIVSNHGGRQLDGAMATARALPAVAQAVAGRVPVLVDGGIRGGYDVVKAVGLGATAVLVGRPLLWGLALDGAAGAGAVLEELTLELSRAMALCGTSSLAEITPDLVVVP